MESNEVVLFEMQTTHGWIVKVLFEVLNFILDHRGSFKVTRDALLLHNINEKRRSMVKLLLDKSKFLMWNYNTDREEINFTVNLHSLYNDVMKKFKKKDGIILSVLENTDTRSLVLKVVRTLENDMSSAYSTVYRTHVDSMVYPQIEDEDVEGVWFSVMSKDYQTRVREVARPTSKSVTLTTNGIDTLSISSNLDKTTKIEAPFIIKQRAESSRTEGKDTEMSLSLDSRCVLKTSKIGNLFDHIKLCISESEEFGALVLKSNVGEIGEILIAVESRDKN